MQSDTIVAPATSPGRAPLAVIRLSGPESGQILGRLLRLEVCGLVPRRVRRGFVHDRWGGRLDEVLAVLFPSPASYTGEDVVEISCHGSPWVVRRIVEECQALGARAARPGEFTQRAFLNGKIDLVQAEGIRDLIDSQTAFQAEVARQQLEGRLSRHLQPVREELVGVACQLETALEFVEDDVSPEGRAKLVARLESVRRMLEELLETWNRGQVIREGAKTVLAGRPNSGKSSIFNYLVREERALVSALPGTTRDALRELLDLGGVPVWLYDTAGIREGGDEIEELGILRSREVLRDAELVLFVIDRSEPLNEDDFRLWEALGQRPRITVWNKCDLESRVVLPADWECLRQGRVEVSARTGSGMNDLVVRIGEHLAGGRGDGSFEQESLTLSNARQRECVEQACAGIRDAERGLHDGLSEEFASYDIRKALNALEDLVGATTTEDVLGRIFSTFCIGK